MARMLHALHRPAYAMPACTVHRASCPIPPHMLMSIAEGIPGRSFRRLLEHIVHHLQLSGANERFDIISFICTLVELAQWGVDLDSSLISALGRSTRLFSCIFTFVRELPTVPSPIEDERVPTTIIEPLRLTLGMMCKIETRWKEISGPFLGVCRRSLLFETLEHVIAPEIANRNTFGEW